MKKTVIGVLAVGMLCVVVVLIGEGVNSVVRWDKLDGSVTYHTYLLIQKALRTGKTVTVNHEGPPFTWLLDRSELDALVPKLKADGVGLGNTDYRVLKDNTSIAINEEEGGCLVQKPNVRKTVTYLRSNIFNPLDPPVLFYDSDHKLDPQIGKLIDTYGLRPVTLTTNERGERNTVPAVEFEPQGNRRWRLGREWGSGRRLRNPILSAPSPRSHAPIYQSRGERR